jgi:homocysteine S-methyltransferase|tara:strand:- start:462 stop:1361 length:900 start_codon:yes stop_codon:yes gene_type:complete
MKNNYPMILDGGLSFPIEKKGINLNSKLWTTELLISNQKIIKDVHLKYLKAGAQFITTCSYQASIKSLKNRGFNFEESKKIILKSITIAEEVKNIYNKKYTNKKKILIAASIGSYGSYLSDGSEYKGNYDVNDKIIFDFHKSKIQILENSNADVLAFEAIPSYRETKIISKILEDSKKKSWISFTCKNDLEISDGTLLAQCCKYLKNHPNIFAIGVNCTSPKYISNLIKILKNNCGEKKIIVYPNSGKKYDSINKNWIGKKNNSFDILLKEWIDLGVDIIGGCCGIGPNQIKKISKLIN